MEFKFIKNELLIIIYFLLFYNKTMAMDHKQLMNAVIALAVVHLVLSAIVGYLAYSEKLSPMHVAAFCGVSVVVNAIILALAAKCRNLAVSA